MAETSGEVLGGRYRLLGERASFPFGSWWEAEDDQGARTVVLRLHPEVVDPASRTKEAVEVCSKIDTPHLVPWADGGVDAKGQGWLAAPMFGPWSLLEHVTRGEGGLPPVEAAPLMHQVVRAVASGEKAGVLHHALTSELIRLVPLPDGGHGIKVYGYGLSQVLPAYKPLLRKQDGYLGVPDYMSPEMCGGKPSEGSSSDIYALGILMYEAVRGRPPFAPTFASASASATLKRHIFEKPLALHVRYANAHHIKSYENICFKALNKTANRRQLSVAELEQELEQLITQEMRVPIVPLSAISGRAPATSRRLRTQVLPSVSAEPAPVASVVVAADLEAQEDQAEPATQGAAKAAESAAPVASAKPEAESEVAAKVQAVSGKGSEERNKRTEGTLVFAGLGPAVRELAENAKPGRAPAEAPAEAAPVAPSETMVGSSEADENEGDEEGSSEEEALPASAQHSGGKKGKRKKGRKGSQASLAAAATVTVPAAKVQPAVASVAAQAVATPKSEAATGETAAAAASDKPEPKEARVRRKDDSTAKNPGATDAAAAVALQVLGDKEPGARKDEQEDWFNKEEEAEAKKPASKAWIFLLLAAAVVVLVIFLLTQDKGTPAQPTAPTGAATGPRYGMADSPRPVQPAPAVAPPAPTEVKPVEAKPAEVVPPPAPVPAEAKPAEAVPVPAEAVPAPVEAKPAEVVPAPAPAEVKPAEVKPAEVKPAEVKPAEVKPTTVTQPTQVKPAEAKPAEVKPATPTTVTKPAEVKPAEVKPATPTTVTKPAEVKPAEVKPATPTTVTKPAEVKPTETANPGSPEESFKAQAQHYMKLGIDAFKAEKFGQAADYFKRAQAADPSNKAASAYLRKAQEKLSP